MGEIYKIIITYYQSYFGLKVLSVQPYTFILMEMS